MAKITYANKINARESEQPTERKFRAEDANEVKESVNSIYDFMGWQTLSDTGDNLIVNNAFTQLTIDGAGGISTYLPKQLKDAGEVLLTTNKITPYKVGDAYDLRVDFTVASKASNPSALTIALYIGTENPTDDPDNIILERSASVAKTAPFSIDSGFPVFSLETFVSNGASIWLKTDTGTVTISSRSMFVKRDLPVDLISS